MPVLHVYVKHGRGQPLTRLVFVVPIYFEGPMSWTGANFEIGSKEELLEYRERFWRSTVPQETFIRQNQLFKVAITTEMSHPTFVKIIAMKASFLPDEEKLPGLFKF